MKRRAVLAGISVLPFVAACGGSGARQSASNGHLIALDENFRQIWKTEGSSSHFGMAAVAAGRAIVQFGDGYLRAFDAQSGAEAWSRQTTRAGIVYLPPPVFEDSVLVLDELSGQLVALRASDGADAWARPAPTSGSMSLARNAGNVVVASLSGVGAYQLDSGDVAWDQPIGQLGGLASDGTRAYVATVHRELIAMDAASGDKLWSQTIDDVFAGLASVAGLLLMHEGVVSSVIRNRTRAYDPATGQSLWEMTVPENSRSILSTPYPVAGHGQLYLFGEQKQLVAVEPATGRRIWERPPASPLGPWAGMIQVTPSAVLHADGIALDVLDPHSGRQLSREMFPSLGQTILVSAQDDSVFVSSFGRSPPYRD
jgi:outer membrane protein assembly factor BamB